MRVWLAILCLTMSSIGYGDASTAYSVGGNPNNNVFQLNLINHNTSQVTKSAITGAGLNGIALANNTTAYVTGGIDSSVYRVNLTTGSVSKVTLSRVGVGVGNGLSNIALADSRTAYTVDLTVLANPKIYRIDLTSGKAFIATPVSGGPIQDIALAMSLPNPTIAYTLSNPNGRIFRVDLTTGQTFTIATIPTAGNLGSIALANNATAYVTDSVLNQIYRVDLVTGTTSSVLPSAITGAGLNGIALADNTTAYVLGRTNRNLYRVDLTTGNAFLQFATPAGVSLNFLALLLQIETTGLSGNNLNFTNYLNANAPSYIVPLFALQANIPEALESAIPTRNAIFTFAAQTTQLAFGHQVYDHLAKKRLRKAWQSQSLQNQAMIAQVPLNQDCFFADALGSINPFSEDYQKENISEILCKKEARYFPWLGVFGEYTHERSQHQTPSFETSTGGLVLANDYCRGDHSTTLLGGGASYAYTHVHEANGAGHAYINQGALVLYAAWAESKWYVDWALWGGYYHAHNVREINLSGVGGGSAASNTHGWQLTPHFEIGYDHGNDWFCAEPFAMIDWVACWEDGFQEHGAGRLNMGQNDRFCSLLRNEFGVRFNETLLYGWGTVTFREKGSFVYQKAFQTGRITAFLVDSPGTFVVSTLTGAQNLGVIEFESLFVSANKKYPYGAISYQGEFRSRYQSHQAIVTIGMDF